MIHRQIETENSHNSPPAHQPGSRVQPLAQKSSRKYLLLRPDVLGVLAAIALATAIRLVLIGLGWPTTNSDEGTMGLMALHIAYHGELPIFFYGQAYLGALEAYIGAMLFHIVGPSLFALRLGLILLFDAFLLVMYLLTRLLYSKNLALATIILLSFGSIETFTRQLKAVGGALETMLFGSLILLLASWLAVSYSSNAAAPLRKRRAGAYILLGLATGLGLWSHMLVIPFVALASYLLILFCWRDLLSPAPGLLLVGLLIGLLPLIVFNVQYPQQNSLHTLLQLRSTGGTGGAIPLNYSWRDQVLGTVLVSIPMATGASPLCPTSAVPGQWRLQTSCMLFQGCWGVAFLLLWLVAVFFTLRELRGWPRVFTSSCLPDERRSIIIRTARLAILASVGLTLLVYVFSPAPALVPVTSARYLVGLLIALPAIFWPLWTAKRARNGGAGTRKGHPYHDTASSGGASYGRGRACPCPGRTLALCLFVSFIFLLGTITVFAQVPAVQATNQQQYALVNDLLHLRVTRVYSDYWTCDRLTFQSNERIICSVVGNDLRPGQNRYPAYRSIVENDPSAAYLLPLNSPQALAFAQNMLSSPAHYQRLTLDGYVLYQPEQGG